MLGLVAFPFGPQLRSEGGWWKDLTGSDPEDLARRKDRVEEAGPLPSGKRLAVMADPSRVQWSYEPGPSAEAVLPDLGGFCQEIETFLELMAKWLPKAPPLRRLGLLAHLARPVSSHQEGYGFLNSVLQTVDVDPRSTDFLYRVNRCSASSAAPAVEINQLATWAVAKVMTRVATLTEEPVADRVVTEGYFVIAELDINTRQGRTEPLPPPVLVALVKELGQLARDRAERGDFKE